MTSTALAYPHEDRSFARAAIIALDPSDVSALRDCFRRCGVKLAIAPVSQPARLEFERFESCVVKLVPGCELFLDELRKSTSTATRF